MSESRKRLCSKWLLFQIVTLIVATFGGWAHPHSIWIGALELGIPAFIILSLPALFTWWLEERSFSSKKTSSAYSFFRVQWRYQFIPLILSQIIIVPLAAYFGGFS